MSVNLKLLRIQNGLTLESLAHAAGLTRSFLSKVERGLSTPSIGTALQLAKALGVSVEQLFGQDAPATSVSIARGASIDAAFPQPIAGQITNGRLSAFVMRPSQNAVRKPSSRHAGEELLYVLSGCIDLQLSDRTETLHAGDCAHFDSAIPHKATSLSKPEARLLLVIVPADEAKKAKPRRAASAQPARRSLPRRP
jgi:transcriptional regulator with XRE-family HTH domain